MYSNNMNKLISVQIFSMKSSGYLNLTMFVELC